MLSRGVMTKIRVLLSVALASLIGAGGVAHALSLAPPRPLSERVGEAEKVFAGTLVEREERGDWVQAELRVDTPLRGVAEGQKVKVTWRKRLGDFQVYDAKEGQRGVALLKDKHEGRYWLRADKFESLEQLDEVRKLLGSGDGKEAGVPTFEEWVKAGKPLPKDRMWTGGTPWFDETKGARRSAEEVYEMIYGQPAAGAKKPEPAGRFPAHWGDPPMIQTRDLRPLPGGYGKGSSTLAKWIEANMAKDAAKAKEADE